MEISARVNLKKFLTSTHFNDYSKDNPKSAREISKFLNIFLDKYKNISGVDQIYKILFNTTCGKSSKIKWFNIFSQIRCTNFLLESGIKIEELESKKDQKVIDMKLNQEIFCDVKSFLPRKREPDSGWTMDTAVIEKFLKEVIEPAFEKQKTNLLIIDSIFSENSSQYRFLTYFLDFLSDSNSYRYKLIYDLMEMYLQKIMILEFIDSISINPRIKFKGKCFLDLY